MEGYLKRGGKVREWTISNNVVCGNETVSFYAVDFTLSEELRGQLGEFHTRLPEKVKDMRR
jgi:hypothetical protein